MVTKATRDVIDLTVRPVTDFVLDGTGTASIDSTPIGVTTPDVGNFSTSSITALTAVTTASFGSATITGGLWGYPVASVAQIAALTNAQQVLVELSDNSLAQVDINDLPINKTVTDASLSVAIPDNGLVLSSDGLVYVNNSGAAITPTTGLTGADLATDGFTAVAGGAGTTLPADAVGQLTNDGAGVLTWSVDSIKDASLTVAIIDNELVLSSDGLVYVNNSGATITPTTGITGADLATDGFTAVTPTAASTTTSGLVELATDAEAAAGTDTTRYINAVQLAANAGGSGPATGQYVENVTDGRVGGLHSFTANASPTGNAGAWWFSGAIPGNATLSGGILVTTAGGGTAVYGNIAAGGAWSVDTSLNAGTIGVILTWFDS